MLAGVALGPFGLGRLAERAPWLAALSLTNVEAIGHLAEFGVVVLLFTIGLELSFERLKSMRRLVFGLGLAQLVLARWALGLAAYALGQPPAAAAIDRRGAVAVLDRDRHAGAGRAQAARRARRPRRASRCCCCRTWRSRRCW